MERFLAVEPTLLVTTLDPEYGDRYLHCDRFSPSLHGAYGSIDSHAERFRFSVMAQARADLIETLKGYVRNGNASVEDILRLDEDHCAHMIC